MHPSSHFLMWTFINRHLSKEKVLRILDVGSYDVNGTYRAIFNFPKWEYVGLDLEQGPNVDCVAISEYCFGLPDNSFDVVVSGNTVEHVKDIFLWINELARVVKPEGLICVVSPTKADYHPFPVDCWRIMHDGMRFLFEKANLLEISVEQTAGGLMDVMGIAKKR